jgi:hypothetical protein
MPLQQAPEQFIPFLRKHRFHLAVFHPSHLLALQSTDQKVELPTSRGERF